MSMIMSLIPSAIWRWIGIAGAGLMAVLAILNLRSRLSASRAKARKAERRIRTMKEAQEIRNDVDTMDRHTVDDNLAQWMR